MEVEYSDLTLHPHNRIGTGKQVVFCGMYRPNPRDVIPVAVKVIRYGLETYEDKILSKLDHPNIIKCYGRRTAPYSVREIIPGALDLILFEFIEGIRLFDYFQKKHPIEEIEFIMAQLYSAVSYMHKQGVIHYDLHALNILITNNLRVKIIDFGQAVKYGQDPIDPTYLISEIPEETMLVKHTQAFTDGEYIDTIQISNITKILLDRAIYTYKKKNSDVRTRAAL